MAGVEEFPHTLLDLERRFPDERSCEEYLASLRWAAGFVCPGCGAGKVWRSSRGLRECAGCGRQTSVRAGTIFQDSRLPLLLWFRAIWWVTSQKTGASALGLQKVLGLGSYRTAWACLHKLRRAMVRPGREPLAGPVEVDETFVGGHEVGGGRRHIGKKALVAVAAEVRGKGVGRIRLRRVQDSSADSLLAFIRGAVVPGALVITDGLPSYGRLPELGYRHEVRPIRGRKELVPTLLPAVHRVASLLKRWLLGTHQGSVSREHLDEYLEEFTFRFNRRASRHRGLLSHRLLEQAVAARPAPYASLIKRVRSARRHNA